MRYLDFLLYRIQLDNFIVAFTSKPLSKRATPKDNEQGSGESMVIIPNGGVFNQLLIFMHCRKY